MNSKILVGMQFFAILAIMIPKSSIMITPYWWIFPSVSTVLALWIFLHNKIGNFNIVPEIREDAELIMTGPYRYIRHPMYSALILFMLGIVLWHFTLSNLLFLLIMIVAVWLKADKEERLWSEHHEEYASYKKRTKMLIAFLF